MRVHSKNISLFLKKCHRYAKEILVNEMNINMKRTRFEYNRYLYPLHFVCFEDNNLLGYFDHSNYTIGINKKLIYTAKETTLKNIIRHELAHLYCFLQYGRTIKDHGVEYREVCKSFDWDKEIYSAKLNLEEDFNRIEGEIKAEGILSKVKKLLKLADSSNEYESQIATKKANELLLKYNLQKVTDDDTEYYVASVMNAKKKTALMTAIYDILPLFLVRPVFNHTKNGIELEITGTLTNIELASYVADFLSTEMERLYKVHRSINPHLKGISAKNSFMRGVSKGYIKKVKSNYNKLDEQQSKALVVVEHNLTKTIGEIYKGLSFSYSNSKSCRESENAGKKAGAKMNINPALKQGQKAKTRFLDWMKSR
jgi:hypothetical protein